jgi:hypothetical protein
VVPLFNINNEYDFNNSLINFDLNNAHCYDPNEEFKLRQIIYIMDEKKFINCIKIMGSILNDKLKNLNETSSL